MIHNIVALAFFGLATAYSIEKIDSKVSVNISYSPIWSANTNSVYYIADKKIIEYDFGKNKFSNFTIKGFGNEIPRFLIPVDSKKMLLATLSELAMISRKENSRAFMEDEPVTSLKSKNLIFSSNGKCDIKGRLFLVSFDDSIKGQDILWKVVDGSLKKVKVLGPTPHYEFAWNKEGDKLYFTSESGDKTIVYEYEFDPEEGFVGAQRSLIEFYGKGVGISAAADGSLLVEDFYQPIIYRINVTSMEIEDTISLFDQEIPNLKRSILDSRSHSRSYLQSAFVGENLRQLFVIKGILTNPSLSTYSFEQYLIDDLDFQGIALNKCNLHNM